ncbi:MAG: orotate phosphoribosyltransferase [Bacteroidota bacterium]
MQIAEEVAKNLLQIGAVKLSPQEPFTWASGLKSPIYCDNRYVLSFPEARNLIKNSFASIIKEQYKDIDVIAGVATGAIAHGVLVAEVLEKPFIYVRSSAKAHGLGNMVEGKIEKGNRVLVIEDLISTGGSSLKAIEALREAGAEVIALGAIFTYGFEKATQAFAATNCPFFTLSNYPVLIEMAIQNNYVSAADKDLLMKWYANPEKWGE